MCKVLIGIVKRMRKLEDVWIKSKGGKVKVRVVVESSKFLTLGYLRLLWTAKT